MKRKLNLIEETSYNMAKEVIKIIESLSKKQQEAFMAEQCVYNNAVSDTDRQKIEGYFSSRYAL